MDFLADTKIDFLKHRFVGITLSLIVIILAVVSFFFYGLNFGIDFAGGTQVQLKFVKKPSIDQLRKRLEEVGLGNSTIQTFGESASNEILIRVSEVKKEDTGDYPDVASKLIDLIQKEKHRKFTEEGKLNLNTVGHKELIQELEKGGSAGRDTSGEESISVSDTNGKKLAERIMSYRKDHGGLIKSYKKMGKSLDLDESQLGLIRNKTFLGNFSVRRIEKVGPKIGAELKKKAFLAIVLSLVFILGYIWYRFQFQYGIGAIAALVHDITITMGFLSFFRFKFSLSIIAALLTIVGYSLNDTIVIFDRIRENRRTYRAKNFYAVINQGINESLSRTFLTSITTLIVVLCLYFFGGEVIHGFAFTLLIGVIVGTYSSMFTASPVIYAWHRISGGTGR